MVVVDVSVKEQCWVLSLFLRYLTLYKKTKEFHPNPSLSIRLLKQLRLSFAAQNSTWET